MKTNAGKRGQQTNRPADQNSFSKLWRAGILFLLPLAGPFHAQGGGLTMTCATNKTVECGTNWVFDPPLVFSTCCSTGFTLTVAATLTNGTCPMVISRIWLATDCCTNSITCTQVVTVVDTTPPFFSFCPPPKTVPCGPPWDFDTPTAGDLCCGTNVTITIVSTTVTMGICPQVFSRVWKATDCCSNSITCTQMVTVVGDTAPPMVICPTNKTVPCGTPWTFDAPTGFDLCCGSNITIAIVSTVTNGACPPVATRIWTITDCCTNSVTCTQMVTVVGDPTPPVVTCASNKTVLCGSAWAFDTPAAYDLCCGTNVSIGILSTVTNFACPPVITRTWGIADCCGNFTMCTQAVTVAMFLCPPNKTIECGTPVTFDPPTFTNTMCCGTNFVLFTHTNLGSCVATKVISRAWLLTDCCSNTLTCTQTVTIVDTTPPVLVCAPNKTVTCGTPWTFDPPVFFGDACCIPPGIFIPLPPVTNNSCPPVIAQTWKATDCCSNISFCTQFVTNIVPPGMVGLICLPDKTVQCGTPWSFDAPSVFSPCCGTNVFVSVVGTVTNGMCPKMITRTWVAADCCSNITPFCSQTVTVVDTNPPILICATNKTVQCGSTWSFDPPSVSDACCTNVNVFVASTITNGACPPVVSRTWVAIDCCNNVTNCTQMVTVFNDTNPPAIVCSSNITVLTCSSNISVSWSLVASDTCSSVTVTSSPSSGSLFDRDTTNTVIAVATDACGNTNSCSFVVVVRRPAIAVTIDTTLGTIALTWEDGGVLQRADTVFGPWSELTGEVSGFTTNTVAPQQFFRLKCP